MRIHEINLQTAVGGGEIYTRSLSKALADAGAGVTLYVHSSNRFWDTLDGSVVKIVPVSDWRQINAHLPESGATLLSQSRIPDDQASAWGRKHRLAGFAHMPILGRSASEFETYSTVFTVSKYCVDLLRKAGIAQVFPEPIYGTYEVGASASPKSKIRATSPYHWDSRKGRDRILAAMEPILQIFRTPAEFDSRPGLALGIVSLISPIKQFPALFELLAPKIARIPRAHLEIFGNGGYAQVRDLRRALRPLGGRARFWGYQREVAKVYPLLDYLMTGLPDKEALGLNVLEAQAMGTPVLAPRAPPFTETVADGVSGFLYEDPRIDGGREFEALVVELAAGKPRPDPRAAVEHLGKFSYAALVDRARRMLQHLESVSVARTSA